MAFSLHSHSGQFCPGHAVDSLEDVIQTAIARGFRTFGLTEHMPRNDDKDRYPEEESLSPLAPRHEDYLLHASHLRAKYASKITILIGFEGEYIRPAYGPLIKTLASNPLVDYFIGSVHHVHETPIDYDEVMYASARTIAGGTDEKLFEDYFDLQLAMLEDIKPRVVGHFDLIRLLSDEPNADIRRFPRVWEKVTRNLKVIAAQGGLVEINTSALRKGLLEPYPKREIVETFLEMGGKLCLSDDSHGIGHVGTNYGKAIEYLEDIGVEELWCLEGKKEGREAQACGVKSVGLRIVKETFRPSG